MNRACSRSRLRNPLPFTPLNLFSTGEQGAWFDPSDMSTLFQDNLGTVPVTAADQVVGMIRDKSGNSNHATQATGASKPILRNTGALWWLEFDGVDDFVVTGGIDFTVTDKISLFAGIRKLSDATAAIVTELGTDANNVNGSFYLAAPVSVAANYGTQARGTVGAGAITIAGFPAPNTAVITATIDIAETVTRRVFRVNQVQATNNVTLGTGTFSNLPLYIGRRAGTTIPFSGRLYGLVVRGALTDAAGISNAEQYMAAKSGVAL